MYDLFFILHPIWFRLCFFLSLFVPHQSALCSQYILQFIFTFWYFHFQIGNPHNKHSFLALPFLFNFSLASTLPPSLSKHNIFRCIELNSNLRMRDLYFQFLIKWNGIVLHIVWLNIVVVHLWPFPAATRYHVTLPYEN